MCLPSCCCSPHDFFRSVYHPFFSFPSFRSPPCTHTTYHQYIFLARHAYRGFTCICLYTSPSVSYIPFPSLYLCSSISLHIPIHIDMEIVDIYIYTHRSSYTCTHMCMYVYNMRRIIYKYVCWSISLSMSQLRLCVGWLSRTWEKRWTREMSEKYLNLFWRHWSISLMKRIFL